MLLRSSGVISARTSRIKTTPPIRPDLWCRLSNSCMCVSPLPGLVPGSLSHEHIPAIVVRRTGFPLVIEEICGGVFVGVEAVIGVQRCRQVEHLAADVVDAGLAVGHEQHRCEAEFS